jgi:hypothetical protein
MRTGSKPMKLRMPSTFFDLPVESRTHPELRPALLDLDAANRDTAGALLRAELLARGGPDFDGVLDLILYALRAMAVDTHLASDEERQARTALIPGLTHYLEQLLEV